MIREVDYKGIKMLSGIHTHPGSGILSSPENESEANLFLSQIKNINNKKNPLMVEVGCHWALWSLLFRNTYPNAKNIIIELNKHALSLAENNFKLNEYDFSSYWGGVFLNSSTTFHNKENDIDYDQSLYPDGYKIQNLEGSAVGKELDFNTTVEEEFIDLLHLDIQGSEVPLLKSLIENGKIEHIDMLVVATHNHEADNLIEEIVINHNYQKLFTAPFRGVDGHHIIKRAVQ